MQITYFLVCELPDHEEPHLVVMEMTSPRDSGFWVKCNTWMKLWGHLFCRRRCMCLCRRRVYMIIYEAKLLGAFQNPFFSSPLIQESWFLTRHIVAQLEIFMSLPPLPFSDSQIFKFWPMRQKVVELQGTHGSLLKREHHAHLPSPPSRWFQCGYCSWNLCGHFGLCEWGPQGTQRSTMMSRS